MTIDDLAADGWRIKKAASICQKKNNGWRSILLVENRHKQLAICWGKKGQYTTPIIKETKK